MAMIETLAGSLLSGLAGFVVLRHTAATVCPPDDEAEARKIFASDEPPPSSDLAI